jgi:hypothetical protein
LWVNSDRVDKTTIRQSDVQAVAEQLGQRRGLVSDRRRRHR